jgi:hypothetical protein
MLKTIRELGVKLSLVWDKSQADKADNAIRGLANAMKGIGAQAAAAAGTMFAFAEATAANAQDLKLHSETLGISSERLQELSYAAKIAANVSRDELMGALEGVSSTLDNVRKGNVDAAMTFNRLGLSADIITNKNLKADQVMMMVAERLKGIQDPIARAAAANEIFGASGAKLLPMLLRGSQGIAALGTEARKMGLVFGDQEIRKQAKFQETLNRTIEVLKNIALTIGAAVMPVVSKVLNQFAAWVQANKKLIAEGVSQLIDGLTVLVPVIWQMVMGMTGAIKSFVSFVGGMKNAAKILVTLFAAFKLIGPVWAFIKAFGAIASIGSRVVGVISAVSSVVGPLVSVFTFIAQGVAAFVASLIALNPVTLTIVGITAAIAGLVYYFKDSAWMKSFSESVMGFLVKPWTWIKNAIDPVIQSVSQLLKMLSDLTGTSVAFEKIGNFLGFSSAAPAGAAATAGAATSTAQTNNQVQIQNTFTMPPGTTPTQAEAIVAKGIHKSLSDADLKNARNSALGGAKN